MQRCAILSVMKYGSCGRGLQSRLSLLESFAHGWIGRSRRDGCLAALRSGLQTDHLLDPLGHFGFKAQTQGQPIKIFLLRRGVHLDRQQ